MEQAYRIIVDEILQPDSNDAAQMGLKIQMRYSIPLFLYGQGITTYTNSANHTRWYRPTI